MLTIKKIKPLEVAKSLGSSWGYASRAIQTTPRKFLTRFEWLLVQSSSIAVNLLQEVAAASKSGQLFSPCTDIQNMLGPSASANALENRKSY